MSTTKDVPAMTIFDDPNFDMFEPPPLREAKWLSAHALERKLDDSLVVRETPKSFLITEPEGAPVVAIDRATGVLEVLLVVTGANAGPLEPERIEQAMTVGWHCLAHPFQAHGYSIEPTRLIVEGGPVVAWRATRALPDSWGALATEVDWIRAQERMLGAAS